MNMQLPESASRRSDGDKLRQSLLGMTTYSSFKNVAFEMLSTHRLGWITRDNKKLSVLVESEASSRAAKLPTQDSTDSTKNLHPSSVSAVTILLASCNSMTILDVAQLAAPSGKKTLKNGKKPITAHTIINARYELVTIKAVPMLEALISAWSRSCCTIANDSVLFFIIASSTCWYAASALASCDVSDIIRCCFFIPSKTSSMLLWMKVVLIHIFFQCLTKPNTRSLMQARNALPAKTCCQVGPTMAIKAAWKNENCPFESHVTLAEGKMHKNSGTKKPSEMISHTKCNPLMNLTVPGANALSETINWLYPSGRMKTSNNNSQTRISHTTKFTCANVSSNSTGKNASRA
mmetsp:Transcript_9577/g.27300  ORF Transcript_9577/g.27300 Transcript_9577/m.27300 type:complete len:349 (-) Transcript_9577:408-1454(-)